jgi:diaminopimelate epimerase
MTINFVKAQGAGNDFLLVRELKGIRESDLAELARASCDRHRGVGADGLIVFTGPARIRLFNSDGSEAELSGNGTRCAAALLISEASDPGVPRAVALESAAAETIVAIETKAGVKRLRMLEREDNRFRFEMEMGQPAYAAADIACPLSTSMGTWPVTILDVGNPQSALLVDDLEFDWRALGREIEGHPRFPNRTNVSFILVRDRHAIEVRFYERGAGPTLSSGTGSTGAAVAAILSGRVESPVRVITEAGDLDIEWKESQVLLRGPAEITARGEFYWRC